MHIGIEAERANNPQKTGVEHYTKQLILQFAKLDSANQYTLYLRTEPAEWLKNLPPNFFCKVLPFPIFWTQLRLSWEMFWHPPDLLFIPASALPFWSPKNCLVTIHDVAWLFFPEAFTWFMRNYLHYSTRFAVWKARYILVNSQATATDLINHYNVSQEKIKHTPFGFDTSPIPDSQFSEKIKAKITEPYILFLSTLQPRKNLPALIDAVALLKKNQPELPHKLIVAGRPGWKYEAILEKIKANPEIVTYLDYVSDDDRLRLLKHATVLAMPSLYEGFGMQILEAFYTKTPVISSNVSSLPEVAGQGAIYFEPTDISAMAEALKQVLTQPELRNDLIKKGQLQLAKFSWQQCAQLSLAVIEKAGRES